MGPFLISIALQYLLSGNIILLRDCDPVKFAAELFANCASTLLVSYLLSLSSQSPGIQTQMIPTLYFLKESSEGHGLS